MEKGTELDTSLNGVVILASDLSSVSFQPPAGLDGICYQSY